MATAATKDEFSRGDGWGSFLKAHRSDFNRAGFDFTLLSPVEDGYSSWHFAGVLTAISIPIPTHTVAGVDFTCIWCAGDYAIERKEKRRMMVDDLHTTNYGDEVHVRLL